MNISWNCGIWNTTPKSENIKILILTKHCTSLSAFFWKLNQFSLFPPLFGNYCSTQDDESRNFCLHRREIKKTPFTDCYHWNHNRIPYQMRINWAWVYRIIIDVFRLYVCIRLSNKNIDSEDQAKHFIVDTKNQHELKNSRIDSRLIKHLVLKSSYHSVAVLPKSEYGSLHSTTKR